MDNSCDLNKKSCVPCRGGVPPLTEPQLTSLHTQLKEGWKIVDEHHLEKTYLFPDFKSALQFTVAIGAVAEKEGHHPDIHLSWGKAKVQIWTHKIDGLTESDFILAAKCDTLYKTA